MLIAQTIILLVLLPLCLSQSTTGGTPPPNLPLAVNCKHITIPPALCTSCRMRPFDKNGKFASQRDIYRLGSKPCQRGLRRYVALNPCDTIRRDQVANQGTKGVMKDLARFMYSICETCCDCLPIGARPGEWAQRQKLGFAALFGIRRGNCPAHALFDMCKMWPFVQSVVSPGKEFNSEWPRICPLLRDWFRSPASDGWKTNPKVRIAKNIRRFLWRFVNVMKCKNAIVWEECAALEFAQGKI